MSDPLRAAKTSYDTRADTFYFTFTREKPQRYVEDDEGLVWRFNPQGEPVGVTVQAYHRLWADRRLILAAKIARPFHLEAEAVVSRLPN